MKINKPKLTATISIILLTISAVLMAVPVEAQDNLPHGGGGTPVPSDWTTGNYTEEQAQSGPLPSGVTVEATTDTKAYISFRPNPVGEGQNDQLGLYLPCENEKPVIEKGLYLISTYKEPPPHKANS